MIHQSASFWQTTDWQLALKKMIRNLDDLLEAVELNINQLPASVQACREFELKVPLHYLSLIEKGNPLDPLLLQILPQQAELIEQAGFVSDPLDEARYNVAPGLIHKYPSRVLLIANPSCAIHCRYCFRRHFDYGANNPAKPKWQEAFDYINANNGINEVILSGGDPLSCNDDYLAFLLDNIAKIKHIDTLRIHSRIPTIMPERVTDRFLQLFESRPFKTIMVLHINHANELSTDARYAIKLLQQAGVRLLNQSVLLKNINDTLIAQQNLLNALFTLDVQAYYLHLLDAVKATAHFNVTDQQALELYQQLQQSMAGFKLPKLVREIPGEKHKTALHYLNAG